MHVGRWTRRLGVIVGLLFLLGLIVAPSAHAFDLRQGEQLVIGANEVVNDDLYAAGQNITIDGTIQGDAILAGQVITINGTVEGNLVAAAQTVIIHGAVRDTARIAAQAVLVDSQAQIGRDLITFAYSLETRPGSAIGRDTGIGAYQALLAGVINRNVRGGMQGLALQGTVGGNVDITVGGSTANGTPQSAMTPPPGVVIPGVPPGLTIADSAKINGTLTYTAPQTYPVPPQVAQNVTYTPVPVAEQPVRGPGSILADNVRRLIALAIVGLLLLWLVPGWTRRLADIAEARPWPSLGWGAVAAVAVVGAAIGILIATGFLAAALGASTLFGLMALVIGWGLVSEVTLILGVIVFTGYIAQAIASFWGGRFLLQRLQPQWLEHRVVPFLIGLVIFVALTAIPVVGGIIGFVVALLGLGAVWIWAGETLHPAPAVAIALPPSAPADDAIAA